MVHCQNRSHLTHPLYFSASVFGVSARIDIVRYCANGRMYKGCVKNEVPQVRRIAAATLKALLEYMPLFEEAEALEMFQEFNKDEQDSVRLMSIENLLALKKANVSLPDEAIKEMIKTWAEDKSWRIRYMVAEKICELINIVDKEYFDTALVDYFQKFMKDDETEVRAISVSKVGELLPLLSTEGAHKLLPNLKALSSDSQLHVRRTLLVTCRLAGGKAGDDSSGAECGAGEGELPANREHLADGQQFGGQRDCTGCVGRFE
eukprot:TRINITY_DN8641_c0_g3_i1.p2 TRINITY_DN8641_c0_g3~~TRINITY_DN8641_c0_g3_i1.p2  ORF type:complete len:262 (-),score=33.38 TRINITY_DN8641_c0_g3_i1:16-801(-)